MLRGRREEVARAERFHRALTNADQTPLNPDDQQLADIARMLHPAQHQSEQHRAAVKDAAMRAFANRNAPASVLSADRHQEPVQPAYAVPGYGVEITLSDIEEIDEERADEARRRILELQAADRAASRAER